MIRSTLAVTLALICTLSADAAPIGFSGPYDTANWTQSLVNSDGGVNTAGAPSSISITSGNNGNFLPGETNYTITLPYSGTVSFDWVFTTVDEASFFDPFGYTVNGVFTQLTSDPVENQSGNASVNLNAGDVFGFRANTIDNIFGRSTTVISNFAAPVPEPATLVVFGGIALAGALGYRRRKVAPTTAA